MVLATERTMNGPAATIAPVDDLRDDPERIRRRCRDSRVRWIVEVYRALTRAGWSRHALSMVHVSPGDVWFRCLARDRRAFDQDDTPAVLIDLAGDDPAAWRSLAFRTLAGRGWSIRLIAAAWSIGPSTVADSLRTIARRVETETRPAP